MNLIQANMLQSLEDTYTEKAKELSMSVKTKQVMHTLVELSEEVLVDEAPLEAFQAFVGAGRMIMGMTFLQSIDFGMRESRTVKEIESEVTTFKEACEYHLTKNIILENEKYFSNFRETTTEERLEMMREDLN